MGISFQQVQKYEKGISAISMSRLQQICDIMHLPPEYFIKGASDYVGQAAHLDEHKMTDHAKMMDQFLATSEGKYLVQCFMQIRDGKLRTRILDFIAAVAADQPD